MKTTKRIQRKRTKGWSMPLNTVYVGRPTKYGNPYVMTSMVDREHVILLYEGWLKRKLEEDPHFLDDLKGKDLACWCPLDKACHADVLLRVLEARVPKGVFCCKCGKDITHEIQVGAGDGTGQRFQCESCYNKETMKPK